MKKLGRRNVYGPSPHAGTTPPRGAVLSVRLHALQRQEHDLPHADAAAQRRSRGTVHLRRPRSAVAASGRVDPRPRGPRNLRRRCTERELPGLGPPGQPIRRCGSRTPAITGSPRSRRFCTTAEPTVPVAPVTNTAPIRSASIRLISVGEVCQLVGDRAANQGAVRDDGRRLERGRPGRRRHQSAATPAPGRRSRRRTAQRAVVAQLVHGLGDRPGRDLSVAASRPGVTGSFSWASTNRIFQLRSGQDVSPNGVTRGVANARESVTIDSSTVPICAARSVVTCSWSLRRSRTGAGR